MNRWVLLEHKILVSTVVDLHYDFLVEYHKDCLTWKLYEIPIINGDIVAIRKQPNHRLVWLSRVEYQLSNNRGLVTRIDHGSFTNIFHKLDSPELKLQLKGKLLNGLLKIAGNSCQLTQEN